MKNKNKFFYRWYSICSAHHPSQPEEFCKNCNTGSWEFKPTIFISHQVYKYFPSLWRWWSNLKWNRKLKFYDKKTGNKVNAFPNLK